MKVRISKASDWTYYEEKEFENVEELWKWMKKTYHSWIVEFEDHSVHLIIYDDYVE